MFRVVNLDYSSVPTPCYIFHQVMLVRNLAILADAQHRSDCQIILALKAFAMFAAASTSVRH